MACVVETGSPVFEARNTQTVAPAATAERAPQSTAERKLETPLPTSVAMPLETSFEPLAQASSPASPTSIKVAGIAPSLRLTPSAYRPVSQQPVEGSQAAVSCREPSMENPAFSSGAMTWKLPSYGG